MYTVKQVADLANVSVRTLHYYDEIGLLTPSTVGANGYRHYDDNALLRLQQILFYREIGLELTQIKEILNRPDFDLLTALRSHRAAIQENINRQQNLINTIDNTIKDLTGEIKMSKKRLFEAFSDEKQKQYEREVRLQYGPTIVNESVKLWNSYSKAQQTAIQEEGTEIYNDWVDAMEAGKSPQSAEVQAIAERWHRNIGHFYEPTLEILRGLGEMYNTHPGFMATFQKFHPDLPAYLQETITQYVDDLEYAEIVQLLAEDEQDTQKRLHGS
jgi:DNA-binding transcriptional MerR regulator